MENQQVCNKCRGTGRIKKEDGSLQTCFDCLANGRLDVHSKKLPDSNVKV